MRLLKKSCGVLAALALLGGRSFAGSDVNEVGALLVYPIVAAFETPDDECPYGCEIECEGGDCENFAAAPDAPAPLPTLGSHAPTQGMAGGGSQPGSASQGGGAVRTVSLLTETFVTITNAGSSPVVAHFNYIDGDEQDLSAYCQECDFSIPLTGNDTETLVFTHDGTSTVIRAEDGTVEISCPFSFGMLVASLENGAGVTLSDNVLLGDVVVVNHFFGSAFSIPAIPFQGIDGDGDRVYRFDGVEYGRMPRIVATDFLAAPLGAQDSFAALSLFTLDFERHHPPLTDCSVTGFDARENAFSASFQFGCWTLRDLCEISPEFCHPNLGLFNNNPLIGADTHGWLQLDCQVDRDPLLLDGFETRGGVHGAILQQREAGAAIPSGSTKVVAGQVSWAKLLYQSVTTGDATTLRIETPSTGMF